MERKKNCHTREKEYRDGWTMPSLPKSPLKTSSHGACLCLLLVETLVIGLTGLCLVKVNLCVTTLSIKLQHLDFQWHFYIQAMETKSQIVAIPEKLIFLADASLQCLSTELLVHPQILPQGFSKIKESLYNKTVIYSVLHDFFDLRVQLYKI